MRLQLLVQIRIQFIPRHKPRNLESKDIFRRPFSVLRYSCRNAVIGSTRVARRVGK